VVNTLWLHPHSLTSCFNSLTAILLLRFKRSRLVTVHSGRQPSVNQYKARRRTKSSNKRLYWLCRGVIKPESVLLRVNLFPIQTHNRDLSIIQPDPLLTVRNTRRNVKPEPVTCKPADRQNQYKHR